MFLSEGQITRQEKKEEKDEALSRLASIGQISAGIAHEVKNPLTAVRGFLQLLQEDNPHPYVDIARSELDQAIATLENLLQVSKPDLDDESYRELSLASELQALLYLFQDKSYNIQMETSFEDTQELIYAKRGQIKKALFNLVKNAIEAIPSEGVIRISHRRVDNAIRVVIADSGVGIPEEKLTLLGTPFFSTKSDGTGMGLTQVFSTVYQHHGKIDVASQVGGGTTFTLEFPIQSKKLLGVTRLDTKYVEGQSFAQFCELNKEVLDRFLTSNSEDLLTNIQNTTIDTAEILKSAFMIVQLLNEDNEHGLIMEAKKLGKHWARHNLSMMIKLDWLRTLRKVYWDLLASYTDHSEFDKAMFFEFGERMNFYFDSFINHFASSFTEYKNDFIKSQTDLINDLSVPVIPLVASTAILPVIGAVDTHRAKLIQENVLQRITQLQLNRLIIDMSGVAFMDTAVVSHMFRIIEGINLLGCKAILTGLRPEIVNTMIELGISLTDKVETKGTLQQALEDANLVAG